MKAPEGRYIGDVHDKSAPTEIPFLLLKAIIGDVRDTSAPTGGRYILLNSSIGLSIVTLSTFVTLSVNSAKGLSRWAQRCFAALSMTVLSPIRMPRLMC